jgi:hypothetical protein
MVSTLLGKAKIIASRGSRVTLFLSHKTVSTERAQNTEIPLQRDKVPLRFGSTRAKFPRGSLRSAARGNMVSTLRGKATNIASRGNRTQSIPGFRPLGYRDRRNHLWQCKILVHSYYLMMPV